MMVRKDPVVEMLKAFPNCPQNVNRENAPVAMKKAVAAMSHGVPVVEQMEDQHEAHKIRQQMRNEIFVRIHAIVNA
jgi:hypothetical protein